MFSLPARASAWARPSSCFRRKSLSNQQVFPELKFFSYLCISIPFQRRKFSALTNITSALDITHCFPMKYSVFSLCNRPNGVPFSLARQRFDPLRLNTKAEEEECYALLNAGLWHKWKNYEIIRSIFQHLHFLLFSGAVRQPGGANSWKR